MGDLHFKTPCNILEVPHNVQASIILNLSLAIANDVINIQLLQDRFKQGGLRDVPWRGSRLLRK